MSTPVKIVFTSSNSLLGLIIRKLTNGRTNHVMLQYESELWSGEWIAQATWNGVVKVPAETARHGIVAEFECQFDAKPALGKIRSEIGKMYDYAGLVFFGWIIIAWHFLKLKVRKPFKTEGNFCSEFIAKFINATLSTANFNPEETTPEMLLKYCEERPTIFKELK